MFSLSKALKKVARYLITKYLVGAIRIRLTQLDDPAFLRNLNIAYIMKRGSCTYSQKAEVLKKAGGGLAIVSLLDENDNPRTIIPISSKTCKYLPHS